MVLLCLSAERGLYRIDDHSGGTVLGPFYSVTDPYLMAQRLADGRNEFVRLVLSDEASSREDSEWLEDSVAFLPTHDTV